MIKIAVITGPTASGKTELAAALAELLDGEVICADAMQLIAELRVGTARPSPEETRAVPHRLFGSVGVEKYASLPFGAAEYVKIAGAAAADAASRGKLPILCGGTGLYIDSLIYGVKFSDAAADGEYRRELAEYAAARSPEALHALLAGIDPDSAAAVHPNNVRRVIRALEIYKSTGVTKSELDRASREGGSEYKSAKICLTFADREALYARINQRAASMLEAGWLDEARALAAAGLEPAVRRAGAIGYGELFDVLQNRLTWEEAADIIRRKTRNYAKRQLTWLRRDANSIWVETDNCKNIINICAERIKTL